MRPKTGIDARSGQLTGPLLLVCLFLLCMPRYAHSDEERIDWYRADFPPGFIKTGSLANDGYENYLESILRQKMPSYSHHYHSANYSRILHQIRTTNACCVALLRTPEREAFIEYSVPTMIALSNGLFILTERIEEFKPYVNSNGYITIDKLFNESSFKMGIAEGRRYKGDLDRLISSQENFAKIVKRKGTDVFQGLLEMMALNRSVDYVIGYPHELNWLKYEGKLDADITFFPIEEMPKYVVSHVGCTKNKWGQRIIQEINKILGSEYNPQYKKRYQQFLPAEAILLHESYIEEVFPPTPAQ